MIYIYTIISHNICHVIIYTIIYVLVHGIECVDMNGRLVALLRRWKSANAGNRAARDAPKIEPVEATRRKEQQRLIRRWATFEKQIRTIGDQAIPSFILEAAACASDSLYQSTILQSLSLSLLWVLPWNEKILPSSLLIETCLLFMYVYPSTKV